MQTQFLKYRTDAKLRQEDVALHLGVSQPTISGWEKGTALPRADMLPKIAALYGCSVDELLQERKADTA